MSANMNMTHEAALVIQGAIEYASENHYEYIVPEILLLIICENADFREAFWECEGEIGKLVFDLEEYISSYVAKKKGRTPEFSAGSAYVLAYAGRSAVNSGNDEIKISHMIHGIWQLEESYAVYFMESQNVTEADLLYWMSALENEEGNLHETDTEADTETESTSLEHWQLYAPCLNETLHDVNPLIGREEELERTMQILCRKDKNNPLHIGEPGVGKTAIVEGLALRMAAGLVPDSAANKRLVIDRKSVV